GRWAHQARARAIPRDGELRPVLLRSRCLDAASAGARCTAHRALETAAILAARGRGTGCLDLRWRPRLSRQGRGRQRQPLRDLAACRVAGEGSQYPCCDPRQARAQRRDRGEAENLCRDLREDLRLAASEPSRSMPSLKDLRVRIRSVKSTQKITAAMKMVAA